MMNSNDRQSVNSNGHNLSTLPCGRRTTNPHGQLARSERRTYPTDDTIQPQNKRGPSKQPVIKSFGSQ